MGRWPVGHNGVRGKMRECIFSGAANRIMLLLRAGADSFFFVKGAPAKCILAQCH